MGHGRVVEIRLFTLVPSGPDDLVHNIPGMALAQLLLECAANEVDEIFGDSGVEFYLMLGGNAAEDLAEMLV